MEYDAPERRRDRRRAAGQEAADGAGQDIAGSRGSPPEPRHPAVVPPDAVPSGETTKVVAPSIMSFTTVQPEGHRRGRAGGGPGAAIGPEARRRIVFALARMEARTAPAILLAAVAGHGQGVGAHPGPVQRRGELAHRAATLASGSAVTGAACCSSGAVKL
jgi:hypothetical protein